MPSDKSSSPEQPTLVGIESGAGVWAGLEDRIQRLLDIVIKLRTVNAQLMKENQRLKLQSGQKPSLPVESPEDEAMRLKYETALEDIHQLKENLRSMKRLVDEHEADKL